VISSGSDRYPLVERDRELAELGRTLDAAAAGDPQLVAIGGPPGIGKTTLARRAELMARERDFTSVWCELEEGAAVKPYELWLTIITRAFAYLRESGVVRRDLNVGDLTRIFGRYWYTVVQLIPELLPSAAAAEEIVDPELPRRPEDLVDALISFLRYLSERRPFLIIADNLHLCDADSLIPIEVAAASIDSGRIMAILSYRANVPVAVDGPLADCLGRLDHYSSFIRMLPRPLSARSIAMIADAHGVKVNEETVELIYERTEGNPLLVRELVELIGSDARGRLSLARSASGSLTPGEETMAAIVAELPSRCRDFFVFAAATGREFDTLQVVPLLGRSRGDGVEDCLGTAVQLGLVVAAPSHLTKYRFVHAVIQNAVLGLVEPADRRDIALRVGAMLEERYRGNEELHAEELYPHFLAAGGDEPVRKGIRYALAAGRSALANFAWRHALRIYLRLLSEFGGQMSQEQRADANTGLGIAYCIAGNRVRGAASFREAWGYYRSTGNMDRLAEIALAPTNTVLGDNFHFPFIEEAVQLLPEDHPRRDVLMWAYAQGLIEAQGRYEEAEITLRELISRARRQGNRRVESRLLIDAAYLETRFSRFENAIETGKEAEAHGAIEPDVFVNSHVNFVLMQAYLLQGNIQAAHEHALRSRDAVLQTHDNLFICAGIAHVLSFALRRGDWQLIKSETERGFAIDPGNLTLLPIRAMAEYYQGNTASGDLYLDRLNMVSDGYPAPGTLISSSLASVIAHRCEITGSREYLDVADSLIDTVLGGTPVPFVELRLRVAQAILAALRGDGRSAMEASNRLSAMPTYNLIREYRIERALAIAQRATGDFDQAARHLLEAANWCRKYEDQPVLAWTYADYGDVVRDPRSVGSDAEALHAYRSSLAIARRLGMGPLVDRVQKALRELASRNSNLLSPRLGNPLTAREIEILTLVAKGRTNREIARELSLSDHTVSNHIRHIFRKTGAANRIEAVQYAESEGLL